MGNSRYFSGLALGLLLAPPAAHATDVSVIGLFPGKAVVSIDRGKPRTLAVGQRSPEGVKLLSATSKAAEFEIGGQRRTLTLGQDIYSNFAPPAAPQVTMARDPSGHYTTTGSINGVPVTFLVDTGATMISLPMSEAKRMGIEYYRGERGISMTANGPAVVWKVRLANVKVGDISVNNVDAVVHEHDGLGVSLLGMSFLNRVDMRRDGESMTLIKRY